MNGYMDLLRSLVCTTTAQHVSKCHMCVNMGNLMMSLGTYTVSKINRAHQQLDAHQVQEELASLQSSLSCCFQLR